MKKGFSNLDTARKRYKESNALNDLLNLLTELKFSILFINDKIIKSNLTTHAMTVDHMVKYNPSLLDMYELDNLLKLPEVIILSDIITLTNEVRFSYNDHCYHEYFVLLYMRSFISRLKVLFNKSKNIGDMHELHICYLELEKALKEVKKIHKLVKYLKLKRNGRI